jgi:uncharacterized lipoprotein NlpE involved in copper resistance/heat shock protein HslJ
MKKNILVLLLLSIISCQKKSTVDSNANNMVSYNAKNSVDYVGVYKGILPCADCQGLDTEIAINENGTFCIKTKYEGKGNKTFELKGNFTWNKSGNMIILKTVKNAPNKYLVDKNTLTQLDIHGKRITGNLANEYVLSKQPKDTSNIESSEENGVTVDLNSRIEATTVIKKVNPAVGRFTLAETKWQLVSLNKVKVNQKGNKVYFLKMNSKDARFTAFAGCNSIAGNYVMPSSYKLDFSDVIMTRMACQDMTLEDKFGAMLVQVTAYKLDKETLIFFSEKKKELAKFEANK